MDSITTFHLNCGLAEDYGAYLAKPTNHLKKVFSLISNEERLNLLKAAYQFALSVFPNQRYSFDQFISYNLFVTPLSGMGYWSSENQKEKSERFSALDSPLDEDAWLALSKSMPQNEAKYFSQYRDGFLTEQEFESPYDIDLDLLSRKMTAELKNTISGVSVEGFTNVLVRTYWSNSEAELLSQLTSIINKPVKSAELAAAISVCLSQSIKNTEHFVSSTKEMISDATLIPLDAFKKYREEDPMGFDLTGYPAWMRDGIEQKYSPATFRDRLEYMRMYMNSESWSDVAKVNKKIKEQLQYEERFRFVETDYGLFVPSTSLRQITTRFRDALKEASLRKSYLLGLSPRKFEEFMASLFRSLGYDVELTCPTRDGGADLLCLKNVDGIPFRLAVELKRYSEKNKITAELVRSFVGANQQFQADKMIYVTTSSYTRPAIQYVDNYAKHLVALKQYDQIQEWCIEASRDKWHLY